MPEVSPVLIVEDDPSVVDVLTIALRREGLPDVSVARTGDGALAMLRAETPAVVVLDIGLPDMSGLEVASRARTMLPELPLLFVSGRDSDTDKLTGFSAGADDYVTKPFNPAEVAARVKALLRRARTPALSAPSYDLGRFTIHPAEARLVVEGREVRVRAREFQLLCFLARHEGVVFSAEEIYRAVWDAEPIGPSDQNTVSVHVRRLRERVESDPSRPESLLTVRNLGYKVVRAPAH